MEAEFDLSTHKGMIALLKFIKRRHEGAQSTALHMTMSQMIDKSRHYNQLKKAVHTKAKSYKTIVKPLSS